MEQVGRHAFDRNSARGGFSLVELSAVMSIALILGAATVPAISTMMEANNVARSGEILNDQIALARQFASTSGQRVEVVFYEPDGANYSVIQVMGGSELMTPLTKPALFPNKFVLSQNPVLSPLLALLQNSSPPFTTTSGTTPILGKTNVAGLYFIIRASGAVEPQLTSSNNYLTVVNSNRTAPSNYATIQIDPNSARTSVYRP